MIKKEKSGGPHVPVQAIDAWVNANTTADPGGSGKTQRLREMDPDARKIAEDLGLF